MARNTFIAVIFCLTIKYVLIIISGRLLYSMPFSLMRHILEILHIILLAFQRKPRVEKGNFKATPLEPLDLY